MSKWSETIECVDANVLAVIMGALPAVLRGLAGRLVVAREGPGRKRKASEGIREKKLPAFWGEEGISLCTCAWDPNGKAVGWWAKTRSPAARGYRGKRIEQVEVTIPAGGLEVDRSGRTSQYLARASAVVRRSGTRIPVLQPISTTSILLRDGQVEVHHTGLQMGQAARAAAPANYIPEGMNDLAYYQASLDERRAAFTLVINDTAIDRGRGCASPPLPSCPRAAARSCCPPWWRMETRKNIWSSTPREKF